MELSKDNEAEPEATSKNSIYPALLFCWAAATGFQLFILKYNFVGSLAAGLASLFIPLLVSCFFPKNKQTNVFFVVWLVFLIIQNLIHSYIK